MKDLDWNLEAVLDRANIEEEETNNEKESNYIKQLSPRVKSCLDNDETNQRRVLINPEKFIAPLHKSTKSSGLAKRVGRLKYIYFVICWSVRQYIKR